jgi:hypothetical protein
VLVLISLEDGRVLPIPPDLRKRFARYMQQPAGDRNHAEARAQRRTIRA